MIRVLKPNYESLREAAALIMKGGIVAYPTDTVYGLGCDPLNNRALRRLVRAKDRNQGHLPVLVDSEGRAEEFGRFGDVALRLAKRFWPGPLTLVVTSRIRLPELVTGPIGAVGLRIPRNRVAIDLIKASGGALVGTSANLSGSPPLASARDVAKELGESIDLVIDDGVTGSGVESSVVRVDDGTVSVLREKSITKERIFSALTSTQRHST
jgi:L-threonylcarbamoyladenylate synthase